ncbi:MAG: acylphosphatase [Aminobacteriaceae bacterium]
MSLVRKRFLATGSVQGVGFRHSAAITARRLRLVGWVRNLPDGAVELHAQGDTESVEEMEEWLRRGPAMARVTGLVALEVPPETGETSFSIRHY